MPGSVSSTRNLRLYTTDGDRNRDGIADRIYVDQTGRQVGIDVNGDGRFDPAAGDVYEPGGLSTPVAVAPGSGEGPARQTQAYFQGTVQLDPSIDWASTPLGPLVTGSPPSIDLNSVDAAHLSLLDDTQLRALMSSLQANPTGATAVMGMQGSNTFDTTAPVTSLAAALVSSVYADSADTGLLWRMMQASPSPAAAVANVSLSPERLVELQTAMLGDGVLSPAEHDGLVALLGRVDAITEGQQQVALQLAHQLYQVPGDIDLAGFSQWAHRWPAGLTGDLMGTLTAEAILSGRELIPTEADRLGDLTALMFSQVDPNNAAEIQASLDGLLATVNEYLPQPLSPEHAGMTAGVVGAGMFRMLSNAADNQQGRNAWSYAFTSSVMNVLSVAASSNPVAAGLFAALSPLAAQAVAEGRVPSDGAAEQWLGAAQLGWMQNYSRYGWPSADSGVLASEMAEAVIRANGMNP